MLGERLSRALHRWDNETVKGDAPDGERQSAMTITRARWTLAPSESEIQDRAVGRLFAAFMSVNN